MDCVDKADISWESLGRKIRFMSQVAGEIIPYRGSFDGATLAIGGREVMLILR